MQSLENGLSQLTWEKLWLYMTLLAIILVLFKISGFVDAYIARMRASAELMTAQAEAERTRAWNEAIAVRGTGHKPEL